MPSLRTDNLNIESIQRLSPPEEVRQAYPLTPEAADTVVAGRAAVEDILLRRDERRLITIVGPCSIHDRESALDYARRLRALTVELGDRLAVIMRVYFEKPRTKLGWKGLIYDPHLDNTGDIEAGLRQARSILLAINELGLPAATEMLEPVIPQYITDLVSWGAIGARTTESQTHRQMASGLSMPIGFKNATDGTIRTAIEAIQAARSPHTFIGIDENGAVGLFRTRGNAFGHIVLRGGSREPNYSSEFIAFTKEAMRKEGLVPNILVDCSHANSGKDPDRQIAVAADVLDQMQRGERDIVGIMLESNLLGGRQPMDQTGRDGLDPGRSITDPCLDWEQTETLLRTVHARLESQKPLAQD